VRDRIRGVEGIVNDNVRQSMCMMPCERLTFALAAKANQ
jgi:hypothetical protein